MKEPKTADGVLLRDLKQLPFFPFDGYFGQGEQASSIKPTQDGWVCEKHSGADVHIKPVEKCYSNGLRSYRVGENQDGEKTICSSAFHNQSGRADRQGYDG